MLSNGRQITFLLLTALCILGVLATPACSTNDAVNDLQQVFSNPQQASTMDPLQQDDNFICNNKTNLVYNLDQLSWYVKGDCQNGTVKATMGCPCRQGTECAASCKPWWPICCVSHFRTLMTLLEEYNEYYRNRSKGCCSFGGPGSW